MRTDPQRECWMGQVSRDAGTWRATAYARATFIRFLLRVVRRSSLDIAAPDRTRRLSRWSRRRANGSISPELAESVFLAAKAKSCKKRTSRNSGLQAPLMVEWD